MHARCKAGAISRRLAERPFGDGQFQTGTRLACGIGMGWSLFWALVGLSGGRLWRRVPCPILLSLCFFSFRKMDVDSLVALG